MLQEDEQTYSFFVNDKEIVGDLESMVEKEKISTEGSIEIVYQPQASFKVSVNSTVNKKHTKYSDSTASRSST